MHTIDVLSCKFTVSWPAQTRKASSSRIRTLVLLEDNLMPDQDYGCPSRLTCLLRSGYLSLFLLLAQTVRLFLHTCASPQTPTDGVARFFPWLVCCDRESNSHVLHCSSLRDLNSGRFTNWATSAAARCLSLRNRKTWRECYWDFLSLKKSVLIRKRRFGSKRRLSTKVN